MAWGLTLTAALLLAEIPQVSPAPALQLCYRRQLVLGEVAKFEVSPTGGEVLTDGCEVELQLRDQAGRLIGEFPLQTIFAGSTNSLAFHYATETSPDALTLCPELAVRWQEREFRYSAALPAAGLQATGNSDCEWHQLPLRALSADAAGACRPSATAATSGYRTRLKLFSETCGRPIEVEVDADRVPLLEYDLSPWVHKRVGWSGGGRDYDGELGCIRSGRGSPQFVDQGFAVGALRFDGEGAIFRLPAAALPARAAWRFAFDFKPEGDGIGMEVFSSGTEEVRERLSEIKVLESGALAARLRLEDGRTVTLTSMYKVRPNVWNHVEINCDLDKVTLTLNRREPAVAAVGAPIGNSSNDSWFGGRSGAYFKGMLKNVRVVHDPAAADRTTDVMFFFDTEDYTNDRANDPIRELANIMTEEGVVGSFCVVGHLARVLRNYGRQDVIDALKPHEIGSQTLYHSRHPTLSEATDVEDAAAAYAAAYAEEAECVRLLKEVFSRSEVRFFDPPGNSISYAADQAYYDLGIRYVCGGGLSPYLDWVKLDAERPVRRDLRCKGLWYFNLMWLPYHYAFRLEDLIPRHNGYEPDLDGALDTMAHRDRVLLYMHPHRANETKDWDTVNFLKRNVHALDQLVAPPARDPEDTQEFYRRFRALLRRLRADRRFRLTSIGELDREIRPRVVIRPQDIPLLRERLTRRFGAVREPASWSVADVFQAAVRFLRGEGEYRPGRVWGFLDAPVGIAAPVTVAADDLRAAAREIRLDTYLPTRFKVGEQWLGPADFLFAALEVLATGEREVTLTPREQLGDFSEMPALKDFRIAGGWGINNDEFKDRFLSNRLRWQLWTLRIE